MMSLRALYFLGAALAAPLLLALRRIGSQLSAYETKNVQQLGASVGDGASSLPDRPCHLPHIYPNLTYCDASLSKEDRIRILLEHLTTEEKISLLGHESPLIQRPGMFLPAHVWWNEALHGMAWTDCCEHNRWKNVTVYPQVIGLAATWNRTLWGEIGGAIGDEAMERMHGRVRPGGPHPGMTLFTPNINIFRDPRWGRGQETPGEDPYLTSHYAAIMVMALQYAKEYVQQLSNAFDDDRTWKPRVAATCKHYAGYSLETNRFNFSADIDDPRDWKDTYLPAFDACVHAEQFLHDYYGTENRNSALIGGALGVMCSYNSIDGVPACANPAFLRDRLRQEWGFPGYVVSDCWAIANIYDRHRFASSYQEAAGMALKAGVDLDCGDTVQGYGLKAVEEGQMEVKDVDKALSTLFGVLIDLGYFDEETANAGKNVELQKRQHDELAFEAALQSIVLLKNEPGDKSLPLTITKHRKVTLIGPLGDDKEIPLANYAGIPSFVVTPLRGLQDLGAEVDFIFGCNVTAESPERTVCNQISGDSNATILAMGLSQELEAEDIDRTSLLLPEGQHGLIEEAARCSKERNPNAPVVLMVMSGGPVDLSSYKSNANIDAILYAGYSGQAGGKVLAHVLYGEYNPSGRLVTTMYHNSFLEEVALDDMRMRPEEPTKEHGEAAYPGRTYRFYNGRGVVYPFGHGLSYSSWEYDIRAMTNGAFVSEISVSVTNGGPTDGSSSVLLFHKGPNAGRDGNPLKSLIGFEKTFASAGSTQQVTFDVTKWMQGQRPGLHIFLVGPSADYMLQVDTAAGSA